MKMPWTKERKQWSRPVRLLIAGDHALIEVQEPLSESDALFIREWWEIAAGGTGRIMNVTEHPAPPLFERSSLTGTRSIPMPAYSPPPPARKP